MKLSLVLALGFGLAAADIAAAQTQLFDFHGSFSPGYVGTSIAPLADVNGDGTADWLCGDLQYGELDNGAAMVVSGATGTILRYVEGIEIGDQFGWCVAACGDADGDGVTDFVASNQPTVYGNHIPYVYVISGASGAVLQYVASGDYWSRFGWSLSGAGDVDGDGRGDFLAGAPADNRAEVFSGASGQTIFGALDASGFTADFGNSVAGLDDLDNDARPEFAVGGKGRVRIFRGSDASIVRTLTSPASDGFGDAMARVDDLDGDGLRDLAIGAPVGVGRVAVVSSATGATIFDWPGPSGATKFGTVVADAGDTDADGRGDVLIASSGSGGWWLYSGRTGARLLGGGGGGSSLRRGAAGIGDLNHDGFDDFAVGFPTFLAGHVTVLSPCPLPPRTYCTAQVNSQGCTPAITWTGSTASSASSLHVRVSQVLNNKTGIFFYGLNGRLAVPFGTAWRCVKAPVRRTQFLTSGGSSSGTDCSGVLDFPFGDHVQSGVDPALAVAVTVDAQFWSRDPGSPSTTNLSGGVELTLCP